MDCDYQAISAQIHKEEAIHNAFIGGIISNEITECLHKDINLTLQAAFKKACSLKITQRNAENYRLASSSAVTLLKCNLVWKTKIEKNWIVFILETTVQQQLRAVCFAGIVDTHISFVQLRTKLVLNAVNVDIFQECVSLSKFKKNETSTTALLMGFLTMSHTKVNIEVLINSVTANALLNTGFSLSDLSYKLSKMLKLDLDKSRCSVGLAFNEYISKGVGKCVANVKLYNQN